MSGFLLKLFTSGDVFVLDDCVKYLKLGAHFGEDVLLRNIFTADVRNVYGMGFESLGLTSVG